MNFQFVWYDKERELIRKGVLEMDEAMKESIYGALEQVIDPELGIDIVNLRTRL